MIFVAVGTTDFDGLIVRMDEIAPTLPEEVVMQIGNGQYIPKNCQYFRFAPSLEPHYDKASMVVSHGGLGIIMEVLEKGKRLIGVENTTCHGKHQQDLLSTLAEEEYLIWCQNLSELPTALERARHYHFKNYVNHECEIHTMIEKFLQDSSEPGHATREEMGMKRRDEDANKTGNAKPGRSKNYMRFRKLVRWIVVSIMYYSGAAFLFGKRQRARILVYHSISEDPLNPFSVSPEDFEAQVRFLSQEYNVISLEKLIACIRGEEGEIPPDSVAITLDDGFEDNYAYAYPILTKYNVPAAMFVIVTRLRSNGASQSESRGQESTPSLTWDQVLEMSENGISIGSHTLTHPWLTEVTVEKARYEIVESKARLEERLGRPVRLFAYPGGRIRDFNHDIKTIVAESGYSGACIGLNGTNGRDTDPYLLRRTKIEVDDGHYVFTKALKGALDIFILLDRARQFMSL